MALNYDSPYAVVVKHQRVIPVDVNAIASDLGVKTYYQNLGANISGLIMRDARKGGPSGFAIYVNSAHHPNRQRFTMAHELAHFILHRDLIESGITDDTMYRSELGNYYETQANRMAADILMPVAQVKKYRDQGEGLLHLAQRFQVSIEAMQIRFNGIGP